MNQYITPEAYDEFKVLSTNTDNLGARELGRLFAQLSSVLKDGISKSSTPYQVTQGGEVIHVVREGPIRVFFTVTDDTLVILGVTSKPSSFDPRSRLDEYLRGDRS